MNGCKCKYYELDEAAKKEAESWEAAYRASMSESEWAAMEEWAAQMNPDDDPLDECKNFCKHLCQGKGHPGGYVYFCHAPDNAQILHVDFNESEII